MSKDKDLKFKAIPGEFANISEDKFIKVLVEKLIDCGQHVYCMDGLDAANELMNATAFISANVIGNTSPDRKHASKTILKFCDMVSGMVTSIFEQREEVAINEGDDNER